MFDSVRARVRGRGVDADETSLAKGQPGKFGKESGRIGDLPVFVENPRLLLGAVDRVFGFGDHGIAIFGWLYFPCSGPVAVELVDAAGNVTSVMDRMFRFGRDDVVDAYRAKIPRISRRTGFMAFAPCSAVPGSELALVLSFEEGERIAFKVAVQKEIVYLDDVKELLACIPEPRREFFQMWDLLDSGLGAAIQQAVQTSSSKVRHPVEIREFGTQVADPDVTLVVPLYGRADFVRYQLAWFADDADFARTDLLYVVDDPDLLPEVLGLAGKFEWLFGIGFRVLAYEENRGFAGANNIGVEHAKAPNVLLMNSDVIPSGPGWIGTLLNALAELPDAGAVGPLLEFGDGTAQHAGMFPARDALLPGFVLNSHLGMGQVWDGGDAPRECPMLTAACLLIRRDHYLEMGGLDEGYLVGDFEDSDLCLALRKRGMRLYLVPAARLWHLERQSQGIGQTPDIRQLLTLYNGWRFRDRVRQGLIADPLEAVTEIGEAV
jgi:GT2 family glycosyltransferase